MAAVDSISSAAPRLFLFEGMGETVREWLDEIVEQRSIAGDYRDLGRHSGIKLELRQAFELGFVDPHRRGEERVAGALIGEGVGRHPGDLAVERRGGPLL